MTERTFIISLIESVKKYPCIWDPASLSYGKRDEMEKAWQEISIECDKPVFYCRNKWKNVRTGFLRSLREYPENSTVTATRRKPFYLHTYMEFLLTSILRDESSTVPRVNGGSGGGNLSNASAGDSNSESEIVKVEDDSSNSELLDYEELDRFENVVLQQKDGRYFARFGPSTSHRDDNSPNHTEADEQPEKKYRIANDNEEIRESKEESALMSFFKGIASDVLSLSIPNQRYFKRKIVELVDDLHREDERQVPPDKKCVYSPNTFNEM